MSEAEMREEIQKMLAEADRATLSEVRVFLQYYLGVQGQNGGNERKGNAGSNRQDAGRR